VSEPNEITELATLRQTVAELTVKATSRKRRITLLEQENTTLKANLAASQATLHDIEVGQPVQTLANAISPTPELFLMEFGRVGYTVEKRDGKLTIIKDGNPVEGSEFTVAGVTKLLTKSDDPALKSFKHLVISNRASGGGASGSLPRSLLK
jgi:hypothetical protein